jgi:hypothetical protein
MRPHPPSAEASLGNGWARPRIRGPRFALPRVGALSAAWRLVAIALAVLCASISLAMAEGWVHPERLLGPPDVPGTAFIATASCSDWQEAGLARRTTIVDALGLAATAPDPENPGATMSRSDAYSLFQGACSGHLARPSLLYQIYNRAASFQAVKAGGAYSGALGH